MHGDPILSKKPYFFDLSVFTLSDDDDDENPPKAAEHAVKSPAAAVPRPSSPRPAERLHELLAVLQRPIADIAKDERLHLAISSTLTEVPKEDRPILGKLE